MNHSFVKYYLSIVVILLSVKHIYPQEISFPLSSPEWLIEMFFNQEKFPDKEKYFTGEMENELNTLTIGEEIKGNGEIDYYSFHSDENRKAFAVKLKVNSTELDFYCYLFNSSDGWKIEAIRRFLFPGFIYTAADSLSGLGVLSNSDSSMLKILILMTATDDHLKNYLVKQIEKFRLLLQYFNENNSDLASEIINELSVNGIFKDEAYPGNVFIQIANFESRELGYIYKEDDAVLPEISPDKFIYIGAVIEDWYLYRLK